MDKKLVSIVLPAYKEEKNINLIYEELKNVIKEISNYDFEIIYVNDWSPDNTWQEIEKIAKKDKIIKWINLSRNFGKEVALTAGLENSLWDAVITLDWDWQHPVEQIPNFIKEWEKWFHIVYNKRPKIEWASFFKNISSKLFYTIYNSLSDFKLEENSTDYRLLDREIVDNFLQFREKNRLYRGIIDWMWFEKKALVFDAKARLDWGKWWSYSFKSLLNLAINSLTSFSIFPLRLVGYLGFFMILASWLLLIFVLVDKFTLDRFNFSNIAAILLMNTILIWVVLMSLGLIALYIARIHEEVQARPMYMISKKLNMKDDKLKKRWSD